MKTLITILIALVITVKSSGQGIESYCYETSKGEFKITLMDEGKSAFYNLFNSSGSLQKSMVGKWRISENTLVITWTGANAGMPDLRMACQRRSDNSIKALLDSESRVWNNCTK
jgi:hypothetical protein